MRMTPLMIALTGENSVSLTDRTTGAVASLTEQRTRIIRALCEAGARVDAKDVAGHTIVHHCAGQANLPSNSAELQSWFGDVMRMLVVEYGANINARNRYHQPALTEVVMAGNVKILKVMMECGADPTVGDHEATPLAVCKSSVLPVFKMMKVGLRVLGPALV